MAVPPVLWGGSNSSIGLQNRFLMANGVSLGNDGVKNYITYNNFANLQTTGWSLGTTGTLTNGIPTGTPTFGSGASGNLSLSVTTTGTLQGLGSLLLTSSAATTVGNMLATQAYTIESADRAQVLTASFKYSVPTSPTNGNFSGTSSNSFGIACYDVTNSAWLPVVGNFAMTQTTGAGSAVVTMQTGSTTASVRFMIYNANASAGAIALEFDRFFLGPQVTQIGYAGTDSVAYTPTFTGFGSPTAVNAFYKKNGDSIDLNITFTSGITTTTQARISLPAGLTIDTTKMPINQKIGDIAISLGATTNQWHAFGVSGATYIGITRSLGGAVGTTLENADSVVGTGNVVSITAKNIPIAGWSSNVQMSNDTSTRVVGFAATTSNTAASAATPFTYSVINDNPDANFNGTTYTVGVTGRYQVSWTSYSITTHNSVLYKNGASVAQGSAGTATANSTGSYVVSCNAGDTLTLRPDTAVTASGGAINNSFSAYRISGPAVIAASEKISVIAHSATGMSVPGNVVWTKKTFDTVDNNSHGAWVSNTFTAPRTGLYRVSYMDGFNNTTGGVNFHQTSVYKNGSILARTSQPWIANAYDMTNCLSLDVSLIAGDTIEVYIAQSHTSALTTLGTNVGFISIDSI